MTRRAPLNTRSTTRAGRIRKSGLFYFFPCPSTSWLRCWDCSPPLLGSLSGPLYGRLDLDLCTLMLCKKCRLFSISYCTCFWESICPRSFGFMRQFANIRPAGMTGSWRTVFASSLKTTANWPTICVAKLKLLSVWRTPRPLLRSVPVPTVTLCGTARSAAPCPAVAPSEPVIVKSKRYTITTSTY